MSAVKGNGNVNEVEDRGTESGNSENNESIVAIAKEIEKGNGKSLSPSRNQLKWKGLVVKSQNGIEKPRRTNDHLNPTAIRIDIVNDHVAVKSPSPEDGLEAVKGNASDTVRAGPKKRSLTARTKREVNKF